MNRKAIYDSLLYLFTMLGLQAVATVIVMLTMKIIPGIDPGSIKINNIIYSSALASTATIFIFYYFKWCDRQCNYLRTKPFSAIIIVSILALTMLIPSSWLTELIPEQYTENVLSEEFEDLLCRPEGYIIIAILAPLVEELVFRGGILRRLLKRQDENIPLNNKQIWTAIIISAAIFSFSHLNPAQMPHALLVGTLLGWLYYRTGSIIPGIVYHWVNNSSAFVIADLFPDLSADAKLPDFFNGDMTSVYTALAISTILSVCLIYLFYKVTAKAK